MKKSTKLCGWCYGHGSRFGVPCLRCRGAGRIPHVPPPTVVHDTQPDDLFSAPEPSAKARATDPGTSWAAASSTNVPRSHRLVLTLLREMGPSTADEIETQAIAERLPVSGARIRTALTELEDLGMVAATDQTRPTRYGRQARIWQRVAA